MDDHNPKYSKAVSASTDRAFGLVFSAIFTAYAIYPLIDAKPIRPYSLIAAIFLAFFALAKPRVLRPANALWTKFGEILHAITSQLALAIIFYGIVVPTGFFLKILGKDILLLKKDTNADSYWINRPPSAPRADSFENQF